MRDDYTWTDRHKLHKIAIDADQVERAAMIRGTAPLDAGIGDEIMAGVVSESESSSLPAEEWAKEDEKAELFSGPVIEELERRRQVMGIYYPFKICANHLEYKGSTTGVYEFCLAVSLTTDLSSAPNSDMPVNFELLVAEVARSVLSQNAKSLRTGWPSHDHVQRPTRFKALSKIISQQSLEWDWQPQPPNPDDPLPTECKDEGVDFVAWIPFGDDRPGQLFMLGQCACGGDWMNKLNDLDAKRLAKWLRPVSYAEFQRAFALPFHIPGWYVLAEVSKYAGVTFDRTRLVLIAENQQNKTRIATGFRDKLIEMTKLAFPEYEPMEAT